MKMTFVQKIAASATAAEHLRRLIDKTASHVHDVSSENGMVVVKIHPSDALSLTLLAEAGLR